MDYNTRYALKVCGHILLNLVLWGICLWLAEAVSIFLCLPLAFPVLAHSIYICNLFDEGPW